MTRSLIVQQGCIVPQSVYRLPWECFVLFLLWNPILPRRSSGTVSSQQVELTEGGDATSGWLIGRECCRSTVRLVHAVDLTANTGAWPVAHVF